MLAQSLALLDLMEQRGSGFARMKNAMVDHGLDGPNFGASDGYFQLLLPGPGDNLDRLRVPQSILAEAMPPSLEQQLNDRQREMLALLVRGEELTSRRCETQFKVTRDTTARDFRLLVDLGFARQVGKGRSTRYVLAVKAELSDNRQTKT